MKKLKIITTGGTIDKIYHDANSTFQIGDPQIGQLLEQSNVTIDYEIVSLMRIDSLDMRDAYRRVIAETISADADYTRFVITHGTDTMVETGRWLMNMAAEQGKTIVLTGSMQPARFRLTDAVFNIGTAIIAAQTLPAGTWITMNGQVFNPLVTRKNNDLNQFESDEN